MKDDGNRTSMAVTLLHELAHEKLHRSEEGSKLDRETQELEAETVAYVVCSRFSIESASHKYLATWQERRSIIDSLKRISECSGEMIEKITDIVGDAVPAEAMI